MVKCRICGVQLDEKNWSESRRKNYDYVCKRCHIRESAERLKRWRDLWRGDATLREYFPSLKPLTKKAEEFAEKILIREGFTNLFRCNTLFFCDWIADFRGQTAFIDVTFTITKHISRKLALTNRLKCKLYILFMRPHHFEDYVLKEVPSNYPSKVFKLKGSEVKTVLKKSVRQKPKPQIRTHKNLKQNC